MASSMPRSLRAAFLGQRAALGDPAAGFGALPSLLWANAEVAGRFFKEPLLGAITEGAPADLAVLDAPPPTEMTADNLFGHLVYGAAEARVRHTVARGKVLMEDYRVLTVDLEESAARAREISREVWQRFHRQ